MIRYALTCAGDHTFESWFPSSESFETQQARGLITCPTCGAADVRKAMMAPAISRTARTTREEPAAGLPAPSGEAEAATASVAMMGEQEQTFRRLLRELREHVVSNADYVGDRFATLARQMHEGETEHRSIYGEATPEDIKALRDDDVEVFPLPVLPEDRN